MRDVDGFREEGLPAQDARVRDGSTIGVCVTCRRSELGASSVLVKSLAGGGKGAERGQHVFLHFVLQVYLPYRLLGMGPNRLLRALASVRVKERARVSASV